MGQTKVFGIGLNKTGTRSMAAAMRQLGYRTLHKGDDETSGLVDQAIGEGVPLLTHLGDQYAAYFDVRAIVASYRLLDRQYPGSRFLLTTRAVDGWLESRERHVRANQKRARSGDYDGAWLTIDKDAWVAEWEQHHIDVAAYFAGRPDLLVMDVTAGAGWSALCPFLGVEVPRSMFPWENRNGRGTYAPGRRHLMRRLRDRARGLTEH